MPAGARAQINPSRSATVPVWQRLGRRPLRPQRSLLLCQLVLSGVLQPLLQGLLSRHLPHVYPILRVHGAWLGRLVRWQIGLGNQILHPIGVQKGQVQ